MCNSNLIDAYVRMYNNGLDIRSDDAYNFVYDLLYNKSGKDYTDFSKKDMSTIIETYNVLSLSDTPIMLMDRESIYEDIAKLETIYDFENSGVFKTKHFLKLNRYFYMIPLQTIKGTIVGFILRKLLPQKYSDDNKYDTVLLKNKKFTPMFGFDSSFKKLDEYGDCKTIVVCEGLKDCIYLKQFYPYVLSNNGSRLGDSKYILREITNKVVLLYDNDETGSTSSSIDARDMADLGFSVASLKMSDIITEGNVKDAAELSNYPNLQLKFKKYFLNFINDMERGAYA